MKLPLAPNNGDRHFSTLFNVEETKDMIYSRIYPARDVVQPVWYNISALIRCNFIIKNYVNRKLNNVVYLSLDIYNIILASCQAFYCTNEKGKCEKNLFLQLPVRIIQEHRPVTTKNTGKYDSIGDKKEKSMCTHKIS